MNMKFRNLCCFLNGTGFLPRALRTPELFRPRLVLYGETCGAPKAGAAPASAETRRIGQPETRAVHISIFRRDCSAARRAGLLSFLAACIFTATGIGAERGGWTVDEPRPGVFVLRNDTGVWGGFSMGVSHINRPNYQARKVFDLSALPEDVRRNARAVRLRMFFAIQDYSWAMNRPANGLNESFEIVVNDLPLRFATADPRFPGKAQRTQPLRADWVDLDMPRGILDKPTLTITVRKRPGTEDDYIYPGIDNSVPTTASSVSFDGGKTWRSDELNTIGARGEYMMRLVIITRNPAAQAVWSPPAPPDDPAGFIAYHARKPDGSLVIEPDADAFDPFAQITVTAAAGTAAPVVQWSGTDGRLLPGTLRKQAAHAVELTITPYRQPLQRLTVRPGRGGDPIRNVRIAFTRPTLPPQPTVDLRPPIAPPAGRPAKTPPACRFIGDRGAVLENPHLRAEFSFRPAFELHTLHCAEIARNIIARPAAVDLFRVRIGEAVYGCRNSRLIQVRPRGKTGFAAEFALGDSGVRCTLAVEVGDTELRMALEVRNTGPEPVRFYTVFPHLAGLELSDNPERDYYLFPWGGGVIADLPAVLRTAYGENSCWWQMIDLFSPERGGGVYVRIDDTTGLYKCPNLRKGRNVPGDCTLDKTGGAYLAPEMAWRNALDPVDGISVAFDYLRRDRAPGTAFSPPAACIGTHAGDWRNAMKTYADWAYRVWKFRPYPSKLTPCWNIVAAGWGQAPLFRDGRYRTDYITPPNDVAELMSWWTWSAKGPWNTPMDRLEEELGRPLYERYKSYWVREPVTGRLMYPLNRGDYDGYMPQWGGLPALRAHIRRIRQAGMLATLYTDPILACATTKLGSKYGPVYGIMNPRWKDPYKCPKTPKGYVGSYASYNMCLDTEWYSAWVARTIARVCRETGADGVRLDEYGHRGYVCTSTRHKHVFAEPGHNAWLQALARNVRQVHRAMDDVRPGLVLMTEFPGHDCMAAALDGAIVYDVRRIRRFRPVPVNLFRFFFPECKVFEINRPARPEARSWMLWNAVGAFSFRYPQEIHDVLRKYNDVFTSRDAEPLIPSLSRRIYINRFRNVDRTVYAVLNATGHTFDGPVLELPEPDAGFVYRDLLAGGRVKPVVRDGRRVLSLHLEPDQTRLILRAPEHKPRSDNHR